MNTTYLLVGIASVVVIVVLVWIGKKHSTKETFTGNVDGNGQAEVPKVHTASSHSGIAPGNLEAAVHGLFASGGKIEAIKHVREQTGLGLKEAKELVEAMARGTPVAMPVASPLHAFHGDLNSEAQRLVSAGQKLEAIKLVREQKGLGLKEAKDYVERL